MLLYRITRRCQEVRSRLEPNRCCRCFVRWTPCPVAQFGRRESRTGRLGRVAGRLQPRSRDCVLLWPNGCDDSHRRFRDSGASSHRQAHLCDTTGNPAAYRRASPIAYIALGQPPILVVHGDGDTPVPFEQSKRCWMHASGQAPMKSWSKSGMRITTSNSWIRAASLDRH
jgi:hypothetical protein